MQFGVEVLLIASLATIVSGAQSAPSPVLAEALAAAVRPALRYPEAEADGTAPGGNPSPVWTVRWPADGDPRVEVLANPLNAGNRERALEAEEQIQKAAMQSQRQSQADYEKALSDFSRTGKVGGIREVTLGDDGVAGERYDAESQLIIQAMVVNEDHSFSVSTSKMPESVPAIIGPAAVVGVAANTYQESRDGGPPTAHFCPEQAWLFFGAITPPAVARATEGSARVSVTRTPATNSSRLVVVSIRGNAELVDRVLRQADWPALISRVGG